ncbi:signal peptidase I [Gorillibacterium timonense]|uniref:signal peptidase I n=1 Tax=Gorillibacterium timonense TaxID=1689269 RepID=UPI00071D18B5|nr:signal peptidase I [Gorillibacterium timonense]
MHSSRWRKSLLACTAAAVLVGVGLKTYVAEGVVVPSGSMLPTIQVNDRFLIEKLVPLTRFEFGDIIVFHPPLADREDERFIKRLIGLPGDTIEVRDGYLYRNEEKLIEPYIQEKMDYSFGPITVPAGHYLVLGDNRNVSLDSHLWDDPFVPQNQLIGKVVCRFYPFEDFSTMKTASATLGP